MSRQSMPQEEKDILAENLRRFMSACGLSVSAFALRLQMPERTISRYIAAEQWPDTKSQRKITAVTGWSSEEMVRPKAPIKNTGTDSAAPSPDWDVKIIAGQEVAFCYAPSKSY